MTDQLQELRERIRESQAEALNRWRPLSGVTHNVRETYKILEANLSKALQAAASAQYRVEQLRDDDVMNPAGRERLIREAIAKGKSEVRKYQSAADAAVLVIKANLQEGALPRVDPAREAMLREELRMRVEASPDPVAEMFVLAQDPDSELAACAASSYGESLLRAKGVSKAPEAAQSIRAVAAEVSAQSVDPARRAIGEARAKVSALDDALITTGSITHTSLESAREAAQSAGVSLTGDEAGG